MIIRGVTYNRVHELLDYNPDTGIFTWAIKTSKRVKIGDIVGTLKQNGYIYIGINGKIYRAKRLAWFYTYGYFPENDVDHINRIRDDNRINNLREITRSCNNKNSNKWIDNISGVTGVSWQADKKYWRVIAQKNQKAQHIGGFKNFNAEVEYGYLNCNSDSSAYNYLKERGFL